MRGVVLRHDHDTRSAPIDPVHDARPQLAANPAQVVDVMEQGIDEGAGGVPGTGVHDHPRRLVQHGEIFVLVEDFEWKLFARDIGWRRRRDVDRHRFAFAHRKVRLGGSARDDHATFGDQPLDLRPRMLGQHRDEEAVEALAVEVRRNGEFQRRQVLPEGRHTEAPRHRGTPKKLFSVSQCLGVS
jgi:hypothetical protein